jgi:hypothetical protein
VNSEILFGHIVYEDGLPIDRRKINIITKNAYPNKCDKIEKISKGTKFLSTLFQKIFH